MRWVARALSSPTADTDATLSIFFESQPSNKYLFNCGENTFRNIQERKFGLSRIKAMFISGVNTSRASGIPGMIMSLADSGSKEMSLVGPPGLNHFVATTRTYSLRESFKLDTKECPPPSSAEGLPPVVFQDQNLTIYGVSVSPSPPDTNDPASASDSDSPPPIHPVLKSRALTQAERVIRQLYCGYTPTPTPAPSTPTNTKPTRPFPMDWRLHRTPLPPVPRATTLLNFIGLGPSIRGKFDAKKANELGVPNGPERSRLTRGESVLAKDGVSVITPEMCVGPSVPPSGFMVIECPDSSYIEQITTSPHLNFTKHFPEVRLSFVLHNLGPGILDDPRYVQWMNAMDPKTEHLISSHEFCSNPVSFLSTAALQLRLSELDSDIFDYPRASPAPRLLSSIPNLPPLIRPFQTDTQLGLNPPLASRIVPAEGLNDKFTPALEAHVANANANANANTNANANADADATRGGRRSDATIVGGTGTVSSELVDLFERAKEEVRQEAEIREDRRKGDDVIVTTLGTGSALPSKYRNVLSNLIQVPKYGNILLDAGEGTWGQIARRFGTQVIGAAESESESHAMQVLRDLRCIFISHIHGDHHMGLAKILAKRRKLNPPPKHPLYLIAGREVMQYIPEYHYLEDLGLDENDGNKNENRNENGNRVKFIACADICTYSPGGNATSTNVNANSGQGDSERKERSLQHVKELKEAMSFSSIESVGVTHRGQCYGIVLRHNDGWSIAFSGDTTPCDSLVLAGKGVTLLIHEASLSDDDKELAREKAHSTVGQAIDVGRRMKAENVLLTHFSQRYPKIPKLRASTIVFDPTVPSTSTSSQTVLVPDSNSSPSTSSTSVAPAHEPTIAVAFDCASIPIGSMWKMNRYTPALEQVFAEIAVDEPGEGEGEGGEGEVDEEEKRLRAAALGVDFESVLVASSSSSSLSKLVKSSTEAASKSQSQSKGKGKRAKGGEIESGLPRAVKKRRKEGA